MKSSYKLTLSFLIGATISGCSSNTPNIPQVEEVLGSNWQCYASPDGNKRAGFVIEKTKDGAYYVDSDYSDKSKSTASAIGSVDYGLDSNVGGVLNFLKKIKAVPLDAKVTAQITDKTNVIVKYGTTRKHYILGDDARSIASDYATKTDLNPTSRFFIYRESQATNSVDIKINSNLVSDIGLDIDIDIDKAVTLNPKLSRDSDNKYILKESFVEDIGICTLAYEIDFEHGADGTSKVTLGESVKLDQDAVILNRE